jgi:hypothetical protein
VEREVDSRLPLSLRDFLGSEGGDVYTPDTLEMIVDRDLNHPDIQNILSPEDLVAGTRAWWSAGMPDEIIGFGNDAGGNLFCFRRRPLSEQPLEDAAVWFFDHDFNTVKEIAPSFDLLLAWYLLQLHP